MCFFDCLDTAIIWSGVPRFRGEPLWDVLAASMLVVGVIDAANFLFDPSVNVCVWALLHFNLDVWTKSLENAR